MKLIQLSEIRSINATDKQVDDKLDEIAARFELKNKFIPLGNLWPKQGAWYGNALTTVHGWMEEENNAEDYIPMEIRWKGFKNALIKYATELSKTRVVKFIDPTLDFVNSRNVPEEPTENDLDFDQIKMTDAAVRWRRPVLAYMMYVSDPVSEQGTDG